LLVGCNVTGLVAAFDRGFACERNLQLCNNRLRVSGNLLGGCNVSSRRRLAGRVGSGAKTRNASVQVSVAVEFRGNIVGVTECAIDTVKKSSYMVETLNDPFGCFTGVNIGVVVAKVLLAAVGVDEDGRDGVKVPHEFTQRTNHGRKIRWHHIGVVAEVITASFNIANRGVDERDRPVHRVSVRFLS
jgi:hypothetical protein